jgi:drug/metabolite transporter (DMT)-like permease
VGNGCGLLSGVAMAWMILFLRHGSNESPLQTFLLGNIFAAVVGLTFAIRGGMPSAGSWAGLILLGVVQLGIPYIMYAYAVKRVTAVEASIIPSMEAVLNPIWVLMLLGEKPGTVALLGGAIVIGTVLLHGLRAARRPALTSVKEGIS